MQAEYNGVQMNYIWFFTRACDVNYLELVSEVCRMQGRSTFEYLYLFNQLFNFKLWVNDLHLHVRLDPLIRLVNKMVFKSREMHDTLRLGFPKRFTDTEYSEKFDEFFNCNMLFRHIKQSCIMEMARCFFMHFQYKNIFDEPYTRCKSHQALRTKIVDCLEAHFEKLILNQTCGVLIEQMIEHDILYFRVQRQYADAIA